MAENRGPQVRDVACVLLALTWVFIVLRAYCHLVVVKAVKADDYLALIAQLLFTLFCTFALLGVDNGTGQHFYDIKPEIRIHNGLKWWWCCEIVYTISNAFLKFSIGLWLLRIVVFRGHRIVLWIIMITTGIINFAFFFLFVFQCWPVNYFWDQTYIPSAKGSCYDPTILVAFFYVWSAISCICDWTFCILPAYLVWKMHMKPRIKIPVIMILGLSTVASAATIGRFPHLYELKNHQDFLWVTTDTAIWSLIENGLGIIASSAITLRPLVRKFFSRSNSTGYAPSMATVPRKPSRGHYLHNIVGSQDVYDDIEMGPDLLSQNSTAIIRSPDYVKHVIQDGEPDENSLSDSGNDLNLSSAPHSEALREPSDNI